MQRFRSLFENLLSSKDKCNNKKYLVFTAIRISTELILVNLLEFFMMRFCKK